MSAIEASSVSVRTMGRVKDIAGQRFGIVTVESFAGTENRKAWWWCRCDCGVVFIKPGTALRFGAAKSCGCQQQAAMHEARRKSMAKRSPDPELRRFYQAWCGMHARCNNKNHKDFKYYGGRGIRVCDRWREFEAFKADMWPRPDGKTLDRRDPNLGYSPTNCRWATALEQRHNRRDSK